MSQNILITAAEEDALPILSQEETINVTFLHAPLEVYVSNTNGHIVEVLDEVETYQNIVYGSRRNASFFLKQFKKVGPLAELNQCLNLAVNERTFNFLEQHNITAVHPQGSSRAIDVLEMMLRLQRLGKTLYPCGDHEREEFPGLLKELDMPVTELPVFERRGPTQEALSDYREHLREKGLDTIIFHSRRSVTRTLAAFPELDYNQTCVISADKGITQKLENNGLSVDEEADGNWESVLELIQEI